ncbi:MAG TPA: hypothetical protein PKC09_00515, partial [Paracoccus sp. (in: a-proteobacteria)]|uniref:hypothetical protein n=1 Tax=uncultured Paracoccus sp. TaxID=189685 RepID=UPI0026107CDF
FERNRRLRQMCERICTLSIDDKAAVLEKEVQSLKVGFKRERFLYYFIIQGLVLGLIGPYVPGYVFTAMIVIALLFSIGLAKYLDFPWIVLHLEKWEQLLYEAAQKRLLGKQPEEPQNEPIENGNDPS